MLKHLSAILWWILHHGKMNNYGYLDADYIDWLAEDQAAVRELFCELRNRIEKLEEAESKRSA